MVCVTKFYLNFVEQDGMTYGQLKKNLFKIQNEIRAFKNRASSEYWSFITYQMLEHDKTGKYPTEEDLLGYKLRSHFYTMATGMIPELNTGNVSQASEDVCKYFFGRKKELFAGRMSAPSYGSNQPIIFHNKSIVLEKKNEAYYLTLSVFSNEGKKTFGLADGRCRFVIWHKSLSPSIMAILDRCLSGEYKISASHIKFCREKNMYEFALSYKFDMEQKQLDKDKILGIDLGIAIPLVAAISDEEKRLLINGNEIQAFRDKTESIRRNMSKARSFAGDGSVGRGRSTRMKPVDKIGTRIANFRDTKNGAWSRSVVEFAAKNGCGTIQMEDLTGIAEGKKSKFLKGWAYYDLQQKIRYKANMLGINVALVDPKYTSQRCSCCGYISEDNRLTQAEFICRKCQFTANADYNAARNIATRDIAEIIEMQCEQQGIRKSH